MHIKKHLGFDALIQDYSDCINKVIDQRRKASTNYTVHDVMMSALACMYMQSSSLLDFQTRLALKSNRNNLKGMFGVNQTPKTTAMKDLIDVVKPEELAPTFKTYMAKLQRSNMLKDYQFIDNKYLIALDGSEYFSSKTINCDCCLKKTHKNGTCTYSHQALQAALVSPNKKQVIPLMPEDISNTDGNKKQDCETNAAKRLIPKIRKTHPRMPMIWLADSLYATTPFIELIQQKSEDNFIFRIKKGDHKHLYECIDNMTAIKHENTIKNGKETLYYHWYENINLHASSPIQVNVVRVYVTKEDRYGNKASTIVGVWATDLAINQNTVVDIVRAARARWMVENECFNILKTHGYAIDHSYGHGQKNLAFNFYTLILLAFTLHQIHELTDKLFQKARGLYIKKYALWHSLQFLFNLMVFTSWVSMMEDAIMIRNPEFEGLKPPI